jgi:hypothetical protein
VFNVFRVSVLNSAMMPNQKKLFNFELPPTPTQGHTTTMTSDITHRTLWCFVEHNSAPFEVTTPVNVSINRLKELIHEKRKNTLSNIDACNLVLWKVCVAVL